MSRAKVTHSLVKECIFTALMQLMEKQDYEKITITEIAKRAGVSRMAYYRIYQSKDDILKFRLAEIFDTMLSEVQKKHLSTDQEFFQYFFTEIQENQLLFQNAFKANLQEFVWKRSKEYALLVFHTFFCPKDEDHFAKYRLCFFTGGFLHIAREWLENGMREDIPTMTTLCCRIVHRIRNMRAHI